MPSPYVLGISAYYHDSAAALVCNGKIVAAAQEERFTRRKGDDRFPTNAVDYVLAAADLLPDDLAAVAFYDSSLLKLERMLSTYLVGSPRSARAFLVAMRAFLPEKFSVEKQIQHELGKNVPIFIGHHHLSHAASAFFPSPFEESAILTVDGVGEWTSCSVGHGRGSNVSLVEEIEYPNSLGLFYSAFTLFCGFKINSGEYKLMGLAPYGQPRFKDAISSDVLYLADDGSFSLNPAYFGYFDGLRSFTPALGDLLGVEPRTPESPLTQEHADIAASVQAITNDVVVSLARRAQRVTGSRNLCLAGGVALNVVAMGILERSGEFDGVWIQPAAGDAGGALGAALWVSHTEFGAHRIPALADAMGGGFLGPAPSEGTTSSEDALTEAGLNGQRLNDDDLAASVAQALADGLIVGVARGRMEFGPRALGHRSILADPRLPDMQTRLNLKTKYRESFRPFAPIVLEEDAAEYFEMEADTASPYMLKTFPVRAELRRETMAMAASDAQLGFDRINEVRSAIPAVTHLDYSARVQTVDAVRNPFMHDTLRSFREITGCSVLVNTSFNVRGEPIVCSAEDAIRCFLLTDIDVLVVDNFFILRSEQPESSLLGSEEILSVLATLTPD